MPQSTAAPDSLAPALARPAGRPLAAVAWMLGALVSFSVTAIAGRGAARGIDTFQMMFWRSLIGLCVLVVIAQATGGLRRLATPQLGLHMARNLVHYAAQFAWLAALTLLPLAQLFALEFMSPLWVALLAPLFLGERLTAIRIAAAALGFCGTLMVIGGESAMAFAKAVFAAAATTGEILPFATPFAVAMPSTGTLLGLACAAGFALSMIATKKLTRTDSALTILFWMMFLQTLGGLIPMASGVTMPDLATQGWIVVLALSALTAHFSLNKAIGLADAIVVAPLDFLRLPLIAVVGAVLYNEQLDPAVLAGGGVVIAANLVNIWAERRTRRAG